MIDVALFALFLALGLLLQRRADGDHLRERLWHANFVVVIPVAVAYSFLTIRIGAHLLEVVGCVVGAWWLLLGVSWLWGTAVGRSPTERATLALAAAFPNTGFVGFPLAHMLFGTGGLRQAVVYDTVSMVVPAVVVCTAIARASVAGTGTGTGSGSGGGVRSGVTPLAGPVGRVGGVLDEVAAVASGDAADGVVEARPAVRGARRVVRDTLLAPPLLVLVATLLVRWLVTGRVAHDLDWLGAVVGHVVGPVGFLLLGLSLPLRGRAAAGGADPPRAGDAARIAGSLALRLAGGPLLLVGLAAALGVHVPGAFVLVAGMPVAFHVLVISRITGLRHGLAARAVVVSTAIAVAGAVAWAALV